MMSKNVASRSEKQCRGHHLKMIKAHGSIDRIIEHFSGLKSKISCEEEINVEELSAQS